MGSLSRYVATYRQFWRLNTLTLMEYKANFFVWLFFTIIYHGIAIGTIWIMMSRFPSMNGWNWKEVFFLYALYMVAHTLNNTFFFTIGDVPTHVQEGDFDRFLVRPLDPLFQVLSQPGQIWPDELAVALIFFGFAQGIVHLQWTPSSAVLLVLAFVGGALIDFAVQLAVATLSFWVIRLDTLRWVVMSLESDFTRYPLSIYNRGVRIMLAYVFPFAFMNYFPATTLLQKTSEVGYTINPIMGWLTPVIGAAWFTGAYLFWRSGVNHYKGTGS